MKRKFSIRREFNTLAASLALVATPLASTGALASSSFNASSMSGASYHPSAPNGEQCPVSDPAAPAKVWPTPYFAVSPGEQQRLIQKLGMDIGREQPDGQFRERTTQSVNEFRIFYYGADRAPFAESFSERELSDLRNFTEIVARDQKAHGLDPAPAAALRFAAHATGISYETIFDATHGGRDTFTASTNTWLYLVKNYGEKYGLRVFADQITQTGSSAAAQVSVQDGLALRLIMNLQQQPRIATVLQAEYIKHKDALPAISYTPVLPAAKNIARQQLDLITLGFDVTPDSQQDARTDAALQKFETLYASLGPQEKTTEERLRFFAEAARAEASRYGIPTAAAAAIRLAVARTGADFGYMMELSAAESTFDPEARAGTSSATGLYQFTEDTWLQTIHRYGNRYGMDVLARQIENKEDMNGTLVGRANNPFLRMASFDLRRDPQYAALMSAEFQMRNRFLIECAVGRELNRTEMYLGHFLGAQGAIAFLLRMDHNPKASAADLFPQAADANRSVFYKTGKHGKRADRSLQDVYDTFSRKFDRDRYESAASAVYPAAPQTATMMQAPPLMIQPLPPPDATPSVKKPDAPAKVKKQPVKPRKLHKPIKPHGTKKPRRPHHR